MKIEKLTTITLTEIQTDTLLHACKLLEVVNNDILNVLNSVELLKEYNLTQDKKGQIMEFIELLTLKLED
jgi:hypothetical protein